MRKNSSRETACVVLCVREREEMYEKRGKKEIGLK
jgi:hypothetical protein